MIQDKGLFSKDATFESTNGPIDFDTSHSYVGTVLGEFCQSTHSFDLPNDTHKSDLDSGEIARHRCKLRFTPTFEVFSATLTLSAARGKYKKPNLDTHRYIRVESGRKKGRVARMF